MLDLIKLNFSIVLNAFAITVLGGVGIFNYLQFKRIKALTEKNQQYKRLADFHVINPNPVLHCDSAGRLIYANPASEILLKEWAIEEGDLLPEDKIAIIESVLENGAIEEIDQTCGDEVIAVRFCEAEDKGMVSIFGLNITSRMEVAKELMQLTVYDQATDLPNKTLFLDRVNRTIDHAKKENKTFPMFVILMEDIKEIVDAFGQEIGDKLLRAASERIQQYISIDATLGRVGDSEFGFVESNLEDPAEIANFVQEFHERCNAPFEIDGKMVVCDLRIGISLFSSSGKTGEDLIQNATIAANRASNEQTAFEFYQKGMNQQVEARRTIVGEMHYALEQNQFVLFYQPQVITTTGQVVGGEALIRWFHPERGQIAPYVFITAAEESGLIIPISEWVLLEACRQIAKWNAKGITGLKIGVNVSAKQFIQTDLVSRVKEAIEVTGISPHQLELELTEGMVIKDLQKTIETMTELRNLGVELAIDDFGTGYSSLSYLKRFPIQKLKIDRAFIMDVTSADDDTEITKGIIQLGHSLKLRVITEGVETEAQLNYLIKHECDMIQGYYFGKPMPVEEFEEFVRQNQAKKNQTDSC